MAPPNKRRWLILIIWLVVLFNLVYFGFMRLEYKDRLIQKYGIDYLEKLTGGQIEIGNLSFSDKFLMIEGFSMLLPQSGLEISAESIHAEYDLMRFIWQRIKNQPVSEKIYLNKPYIKYMYQPGRKAGDNKQKHNPPLPQLRKYFKHLFISEGAVDFFLDAGAFRLAENFRNLNGSMQTLDGVSAELNGQTSNGGHLNARIDLSGGWFNSLIAHTENYRPMDMYITRIDSLSALSDITFSYLPGRMSLEAGLKDIHLEVANRQISADSLSLAGNGDELDFSFFQPTVDGNKVELAGTLFDTFSSLIAVDAHLSGKDISLTPFQQVISGKAELKAHMTGRFTDFTILAEAKSHRLEAFGQIFKEADVSARIGNSNLEFEINNLLWEGNNLAAVGFFGYDMSLWTKAHGDSVTYSISNVSFQADLAASYNNSISEESRLELNNIKISTPLMDIDQLKLLASYDHPLVNISLHRTFNDFSLNAELDLETREYQADLQLRRYQLGKALDIFTFPNCTGSLNIAGNADSVFVNSNLRFYDQYFGNFDGRIIASASVNFQEQKSLLDINTTNASYNYQDLKINLTASGNLDSISTSRFTINDQFTLSARFFRQPETDLALELQADSIALRDFLKYFVDYRNLENYQGLLTLSLQADTRGKGSFSGYIRADSLAYGSIKNLQAEMTLAGNNEKINIEQSRISQDKIDLGFIGGYLTLAPQFKLELDANLPQLQLEDLFAGNDLKGKGRCELGFYLQNGSARFDLRMQGEKFNLNGISIDQAQIDISQQDSLLIVQQLELTQKPDNYFSAQGAIGYNLLNLSTYQDTSSLELSFKGDLLRILRQNLDYVQEGKGRSELQLIITMGENGLDISTADFVLDKAEIQLKDQPVAFEKIHIDLGISDNVLEIRDFQARIGRGKLLIENSVGYNHEDLLLHNINIGQILVYTSLSGIDFYLPQYTTPGSLSHLVISGRNSHYLRFFYHNDVPLIRGDLAVSSTDIIYPPNTDNLMQLVNSFTSEITQKWSVTRKKDKQEEIIPQGESFDDEISSLPFDLDIYLQTGDNVRYVTYPFSITFDAGSYAYLQYIDGKFSLPDALFSSQEGKMVLVGTEMEVDNILLTYNQQTEDVGLQAIFSRKTADGTLIQLEITDDREGSFPNNLQMQLISDNTDDRTDTEKLFRLRYGRGLDDISSTERQNLFQDDLIHTAGGEIENIIIDPVINQFEVYVSRMLKIDYFQMETSFIYNILSSNSDLYGNSEDQDKKYSADVFLENLSLKAGKYVLDDLFLNYQVTFQKVYETELETKMGVYHTVSFRYDMPMDIKFIYEYNIDPYEKDSHQYSFSRTLRFSDIKNLWQKIIHPH